MAKKYKDPDVSLGQARLAKATAELGGLPGMTKSKLAKIAGVQSAVYQEPGYKHALAQYGLTEKLVATALVYDIQKKPRQRIQELSLAADILGMKQKHQTVDVNTRSLVLMVSGETAERYAKKHPTIHEQVEDEGETIPSFNASDTPEQV